jgi:ketosteroid isomerase-like protein
MPGFFRAVCSTRSGAGRHDDVPESSSGDNIVAARLAEMEAVAALHRANAHYIRAFIESDTAWYGVHLSDDFVCTLADGRRIDKAHFLRRTAEGPGVTDVRYDEIDVRLLGEVALVQGVTHSLRRGAPESTRYTSVWRFREGRWQAVAAQLTPVVNAQ